MKINDEMDFEEVYRTSWSGALDTCEKIDENNKGHEFEQLIEELYPDGIGRTELNDLLWFEGDWLLKQLGIEEDEEE